MSIQYFFTKMQICSRVFMNHHNVRLVLCDQVRIWAWCLLSWQHLVNPGLCCELQGPEFRFILLVTQFCVWLWGCDLLLQQLRAIHYPWSSSGHCHCSSAMWHSRIARAQLQGLEWQQTGECRGVPGTLACWEVNNHIFLTDKALSYHLFVEQTHLGLLLLSCPVRAQGFSSRAGQGSRSRRCQGQHILAQLLPSTAQGHCTDMIPPYLIYAACIHIVKDHPGRPFCHWNSNAFSLQPSLCFWKLHAIFCDCVLPLCNPGNISQAFQWTMVLSRTVVLLLTLYC